MPLLNSTPLNGEIPDEDYAPTDKRSVEKLSLSALWLQSTVIGKNRVWKNNEFLEEHLRDVSAFLNGGAIHGPYRAMVNPSNQYLILEFVFFEKADATAFVKEFAEGTQYFIRDEMFSKVFEGLAERARLGWLPQDNRLISYIERGLALNR